MRIYNYFRVYVIIYLHTYLLFCKNNYLGVRIIILAFDWYITCPTLTSYCMKKRFLAFSRIDAIWRHLRKNCIAILAYLDECFRLICYMPYTVRVWFWRFFEISKFVPHGDNGFPPKCNQFFPLTLGVCIPNLRFVALMVSELWHRRTAGRTDGRTAVRTNIAITISTDIDDIDSRYLIKN